MIIDEVTIGKTFNIGNFQSLRVEMKASLDPEESEIEVAKTLYSQINTIRNELEV